MMKTWLTNPEIPEIYKCQVVKVGDYWFLLLPSRDGKTRSVQRYESWHTAFVTATTIQDMRNTGG